MTKFNVILVGFMGTGKSATGLVLASRMKYRLVDMDAVIERRAGKKISKIFAEDGEAEFRQYERVLVQELAGRRGLVVAAGGGVVLNPDNLRDFSRTGVVVCLKASKDAILRRVRGHSHRPLLEDGDKERRIIELLEKRKPLYDAIPHQIDTTDLSPEATAGLIMGIYAKAVDSMRE